LSLYLAAYPNVQVDFDGKSLNLDEFNATPLGITNPPGGLFVLSV
jgi:hypothetical protein